MLETWLPVKDYEGIYEVSDLGRIKALDRYVMNNGGLQHKHERILKPHKNNQGYLMVVLCKEGKIKPIGVHRVVAMAFIDNPEDKPVVDHIDTNPLNNCVDNLRWATVKENANNPLSRINNSESKKGHPYRERPLTEMERQKISDKLRGRKLSEAHKQRLSESHKGQSQSEEARRKNSEAHKGVKFSDETKRKMSERLKGNHKGWHWRMEGGKRIWFKLQGE